MSSGGATHRLRALWQQYAERYDRDTDFYDRFLLGQRRLERLSLRLAGDHQTRRPYPEIVAAGFDVQRRQRLKAGVIERVRATKPLQGPAPEPSQRSRRPSTRPSTSNE